MTDAPQRSYTILVPLADLHQAAGLIRVAASLMPLLSRAERGRVVALGVIEIPEELALQLAPGLAERSDGTVTALRVETDDRPPLETAQEAEEFQAVLATSSRPERLREKVVRCDSVEQAILNEAASHQAVVMGA